MRFQVSENEAKSKYKPPCDIVKLAIVTAKSTFMVHGIFWCVIGRYVVLVAVFV